MRTWLTMDKVCKMSENRIERLYYRTMGLRATMPGPHPTRRCKPHETHLYSLRNLSIERTNQVWALDITYISMCKGYMYLVAYIVDILLIGLYQTPWMPIGVPRLGEALEDQSKPEIINTDQVSQFTSDVFSQLSKGRATDITFIERLWRSVKCEQIYLNSPTDGTDLYQSLAQYLHYYITKRRHTGIDNQIPQQLYSHIKKVAA